MTLNRWSCIVSMKLLSHIGTVTERCVFESRLKAAQKIFEFSGKSGASLRDSNPRPQA
jgi:hypothetical protein